MAALKALKRDRVTTYDFDYTFYLEDSDHAKSQTAALEIAHAKRRTHDTLVATQSSDCPNCREPKPPHRACPHCGYYRGRQVRAVDEA